MQYLKRKTLEATEIPYDSSPCRPPTLWVQLYYKFITPILPFDLGLCPRAQVVGKFKKWKQSIFLI